MMTLDPFIQGYNEKCNVTISNIAEIMSSIDYFQGKPGEKINLSRIAQNLGINKFYLDKISEIIIELQAKFQKISGRYQIKKTYHNGKIILILEEINNLKKDFKEIRLSKKESEYINDIIYFFQYLKKGRGFDINKDKPNLIKKVKMLRNNHQDFFFDLNGLIYPTELCLNYGKIIYAYNRSGKQVNDIQVNDYTFIIE
jgi:hypothetical protein